MDSNRRICRKCFKVFFGEQFVRCTKCKTCYGVPCVNTEESPMSGPMGAWLTTAEWKCEPCLDAEGEASRQSSASSQMPQPAGARAGFSGDYPNGGNPSGNPGRDRSGPNANRPGNRRPRGIDEDSRTQELEIVGVPEQFKENIIHTIFEISKKLKIQICQAEVLCASRINVGSGEKEPPKDPRVIIVRFLRRCVRDEALMTARRIGDAATTEGLALEGPPSRFYVTDVVYGFDEWPGLGSNG